MGRADEYKRHALACLDSAKHTVDDSVKQDLISLAEMWSRLASLAQADEALEAATAALADDVPPTASVQKPPAEEP